MELDAAELHYVGADDWVAVYVGDEVRYQGHSVTKWEWLCLLGQGPFKVDDSYDETDLAYRWCDDFGGFPASFSEFLRGPDDRT